MEQNAIQPKEIKMPWNDDNGNGPKNPWGSGGNHNDGPRPNPWGGGNGGGQGPQRRGPGGGDELPPDLDALLRRLKTIMPGSFGVFHAVFLAFIAGVILWLASGFYFIQPNENGVVMTFGKYTHMDEQAGLKYAFPWPIQQVIKVDVTSERRVEVGFNSAPNYRGGMDDSNSAALMLTGDENIIDIDFVVMWRIGDAAQYLFELRNPEDTVRMVAESAMREIIGHTKITAALTEARGQIQTDTKVLMQKILDEYKSGVVINNIQLLKVDPPDPVIDAFNDVQRARAEAERMQNEAQAYRNDIIPRARGEAQQKLQESEAYKQEVIARAKGDADRFTSVYAAYSQSKDVTTERMYLETIEQVLRNAKTIVVDGKNTNSVLPYLPIGEPKVKSDGNGKPPQPDTNTSGQ